jgi:hypothetical protein
MANKDDPLDSKYGVQFRKHFEEIDDHRGFGSACVGGCSNPYLLTEGKCARQGINCRAAF